jgi:hypothetical protein
MVFENTGQNFMVKPGSIPICKGVPGGTDRYDLQYGLAKADGGLQKKKDEPE